MQFVARGVLKCFMDARQVIVNRRGGDDEVAALCDDLNDHLKNGGKKERARAMEMGETTRKPKLGGGLNGEDRTPSGSYSWRLSHRGMRFCPAYQYRYAGTAVLVRWYAVMDSESIFPYDHILFGSCQGRSGLRIIPSGVYLPQWYLSWYPTFWCMFPDHLEDCDLEEVVSLAIQPINGNLIHAIAERWNPRTNTFWFPWGEMTITLDEFSNIMGQSQKVIQEVQLKTSSL
ncbi:hypothetical protein EJ110_NYTH29550 [Nymphaea thermarum]|nr:hypothetical protein EJ110_NYTH29550 [Nymphaea thermarum]